MLHALVLVRGLQTAVRRGWQPRTGVLREMREQRGRGHDWRQNQHQETPSSQSLVIAAESLAQPAEHFAQPIVRLPA